MQNMLTDYERGMLKRSTLLFGREVMERIASARVIIFGIGGVGSWCAEALVRSGIRHITLVDSDDVSLTNCNRQLLATSKTVGRVKVEVMRERLLEINPDAEVLALQKPYTPETSEEFQLESYDFIIDCIDSLANKAHLILTATSLASNITFLSSMGAALRLDPLKVRCVEFWKIQGDALARALRNKFKKQKTYPRRKFLCVCSEETPMPNLGVEIDTDVPDSLYAGKVQVNGSLCPVTATFGLTLCSQVLKTLSSRKG